MAKQKAFIGSTRDGKLCQVAPRAGNDSVNKNTVCSISSTHHGQFTVPSNSSPKGSGIVLRPPQVLTGVVCIHTHTDIKIKINLKEKKK